MNGITEAEAQSIEALDFPIGCDLDSVRAAFWMVTDCCNRHIPLCTSHKVSICRELVIDMFLGMTRKCFACGAMRRPLIDHVSWKPIAERGTP